MSELLEQLKKKPVPGTAKHKPVTVASVAIVKEDETTPQAEPGRRPLAVSVTMKRPAVPYDRAAFLERIKSRSIVASKRSPDLTPPAAPPAPTKAKRGRITLKGITVERAEPTPTVISSMGLGDEIAIERIQKPTVEDYIRVPDYYMNNREIFIDFINSLFQPYREQLLSEEQQFECGEVQKDFSLLTHQKIVRDYINLYTPYRGLLLYHGLGAGKTCASIAIAEGLKDDKQVIIMTPASLRANYISELKYCGDFLYKKNQFWEFISVTDNDKLANNLSKVLSIPVAFIRKERGAWLVNTTQESNYKSLTESDKQAIDVQLRKMIDAKYSFINYNGLRIGHLDKLTHGGTKNPFDGAVIIIDEAHNFVSRIVNKLTRKSSLSYKLYEYLLSAKRCKIVLLTGTPMINYPNEVGVMFNILRGYITTYTIPLDIRTSRKLNESEMKKIFKEYNLIDYIEYKPSSKQLVVTRNPFGFVSRNIRGQYKGVNISSKGDIDDEGFVSILSSILSKADVRVMPEGIRVENFKALPDTLDDFSAMFISSKGEIMNGNLFKRRIMGLTSYFRSAREELMPRFDKNRDFHVEKIPMSNYQFGLYEEARVQERRLEKLSKRKKKKTKEGDIYNDSVSTYRIFSRAFCNFVFPPGIERPLPHKGKDIDASVSSNINEEIFDNLRIETLVDDVDGRYTHEDMEQLEAEIGEKTDVTYNRRIVQALDLLKDKAAEFLTPEALEVYSPKFLRMLDNIRNPAHKGCHLVYSNFRTLEGIGIFKLVLRQNGFVEFKLKKEGGAWQLDMTDEDLENPSFALYTGTESSEEKEIVRHIFNGAWTFVPDQIKDRLRDRSEDNRYGEIIKVFMITAAGAEGITLRNVRFVNIMESYWHPARVEQVIGRARRICSHQDLPEEERTVDVFLYLMTFSESQLDSDISIELRLNDKGKVDKNRPLTSDEALYEIANIKEGIAEQILTAIKESSIDCVTHVNTNSKEKLVCLSFPGTKANKFSYKPSITTEEKDSISSINTKTVKWKAVELTLDGKKYAFRKDTKEVYDYTSYVQAIKDPQVNPILIGTLEKTTGNKYVLKRL